VATHRQYYTSAAAAATIEVSVSFQLLPLAPLPNVAMHHGSSPTETVSAHAHKARIPRRRHRSYRHPYDDDDDDPREYVGVSVVECGLYAGRL